MLSNRLKTLVVATISFILLSACMARSVNHKSTSVVDYLYPNEQVIQTSSIPHLTLPLNVGVAFVPTNHSEAFTEKQKQELLDKVSQNFRQHNFVNNISVIPSAYLTPNGGFNNLDQIQQMHNVDVITLISYDQKQFTDTGRSSIAYWTLIGAYIVAAEKNDTHTMVDAVVYDIQSRKMLFRAPGTSHIKGRATPVNLSEQQRKDSAQGLMSASSVLLQNLDKELVNFKERVKQKPQEYKIKTRPGYSGGGSFSLVLLGLILLFALTRSNQYLATARS